MSIELTVISQHNDFEEQSTNTMILCRAFKSLLQYDWKKYGDK